MTSAYMRDTARTLAMQLIGLEPETQDAELASLRRKNPTLHALVVEAIKALRGR